MSKFTAFEGFFRNPNGSLTRATVTLERREGLIFIAGAREPLPVAHETELRGWGEYDGAALDLGKIVIPHASWERLFTDHDFWQD